MVMYNDIMSLYIISSWSLLAALLWTEAYHMFTTSISGCCWWQWCVMLSSDPTLKEPLNHISLSLHVLSSVLLGCSYTHPMLWVRDCLLGNWSSKKSLRIKIIKQKPNIWRYSSSSLHNTECMTWSCVLATMYPSLGEACLDKIFVNTNQPTL